MIIDFSVSNYKFITERQTISLEALTRKRDKQSKDNIINIDCRIAKGKTRGIKLLKNVYVFGLTRPMEEFKEAIEFFNKIVSYDKFYKYKYKDCSTDLSKTNDEAIKFEITFLLDNIKYIYKIHYSFNCKIRELIYYPKGVKKRRITNEVFKKVLDYLSNNKLDQIKFSSDTSLMNKVRKDQIYLADFDNNVYIYPITDYYNSRKEDIENEYLCGRFGAIARNKLIEY